MLLGQSEGANVRSQPRLRDSQGERKKKKFPAKGSNLTHSLALSQNKGLSKYQRRAGRLHTGPSPAAEGREAGRGQPELEGKGLLQSQPQRPASSTKL